MSGTHTFLVGDCREILKRMDSASVHCVVTSPPYYGLRRYPLDPLVWGGSPECAHQWGEEIIAKQSGGGLALGGNLTGGDKNWDLGERSQGRFCSRCGAWLGCLGLEPKLGLFVEHVAEVFDEVKRVLHPEGLLFLNLGDSMARKRDKEQNLYAGDLCAMPWSVVFALRERGWRLLNDVIWHQKNATPESAPGRFTITHEYIFIFRKGPDHFFDNFAVRCENGARRRTVWSINKKACRELHFASFADELVELCLRSGSSEHGCCPHCLTQYRRVTQKGERNEEWQKECGADAAGGYDGVNQKDYEVAGAQAASDMKRNILATMRSEHTVGWRKNCKCPRAAPIPATALDCFSGSGTTNLVAKQLGRSSIYIDQAVEYAWMARRVCGEEEAP